MTTISSVFGSKARGACCVWSGDSATRILDRVCDGVDEAWPGTGVIYFARLGAQRTKSKMSAIVGTPQYQEMTIRSWATTTKLVVLLD